MAQLIGLARGNLVSGGMLASMPMIASSRIPAGTVVLVDSGFFATAFGDDMRVEVNERAIVHENSAPLPIVDPAGTVASPVRSFCLGIKAVLPVGWTMRAPGRVAGATGVQW